MPRPALRDFAAMGLGVYFANDSFGFGQSRNIGVGCGIEAPGRSRREGECQNEERQAVKSDSHGASVRRVRLAKVRAVLIPRHGAGKNTYHGFLVSSESLSSEHHK